MRSFFLVCIAFIFFSCEKKAEIKNQQLFTLLEPAHTGIDFVNKIEDTKQANILLYANYYGGAGVGVGDFNNDGLQDIYFAGNMVSDKLYLNQGDFKFKDITQKAGIIDDGGWSTGVTIADVNNDGLLDIYVSRELYDENPDLRKNLLYLNKGDLTFNEVAEEFKVDDQQRTRHSTFLDYDKDGLLDLFLLTQPPNPGSFSEYAGTELLKPEYSLRLLKNKGGFFEDVTKAAGLFKTGFPNGVSASDINNDGWTDIYVANDFYAPDFLFINNQDGTFSNRIDSTINQTSFYSMGVDISDINNDGLLDVFVVDMVAEDNFRLKSNMSGMNIEAFWKVVEDGGGYQYMYNTLQLNNGNGTFSNIAQYTGMSATDWSWSNLIADFDNDGFKDAYVTNGLLRDIRNTDADNNVAEYVNKTRLEWLQKNPDGGTIKSIWDVVNLEKAIGLIPSQPLKNYAFKNKGNLKFEKVAKDWGLDVESFSNGSAYADFDNDGDLDLVVNNINETAFVYRNNTEANTNGNFLRLELSDNSNAPTLGSRVDIYTNGNMQTQHITNVRGIYSTSESTVHFGLGSSKKVDSLLITWPNGLETFEKNINANQTVKFTKDKASVKSKLSRSNDALFVETTNELPIEFNHVENNFDDFKKQVLLPHKLSQFGPAMAVADIDNDGLDDVFLGGATGHAPKLYKQNKDGSFTIVLNEFWKKEAPFEDVDAVFFDVNSDGYKDLYVVSGGNEYPKKDFRYTDRLYINNGNGGFSKGAILGVERISGSTVTAGDYDADGDIDLFVGGRHVPHEYPSPPSSMLLKNENGQLVNMTDELAPGFDNVGMVTDAIWTDYNQDNAIDLVVVGEWMPITLFKNENGSLTKDTADGLSKTSGWWFSIDKGDFDNDGDEDYIVGNLGLNYKYKTSPEKPFDIYYDDFDDNGMKDIVLGYYNDNKHYPLRGFSCSSEQIPNLKKDIKKYDVFASLEIDEVYGEMELKNALRYQADTFASMYIENMGNNTFKTSLLPYQAQLSNINDMLIDDFDDDGNLDVLAINNLFVSEIETPRNDAGTGLIMLGDGKGGFSPLSIKESGFFSNKDAKKIRVLINKEKRFVLVANNNDKLQSFKLK
ncbi:VCBS repeat-containing protein [Costertonia aggregata]|uniref:VCBS repeat-containing protein n=1 Tax=Costertonia aggregata TaxID=343403 RepID=A0A7H9AMX9_9FLAO|nr:VCBS repeat-containing protein [Costertonia aggregata]QLG44754.1 VCBS repeat-containing protein [Costertonia aggregata]